MKKLLFITLSLLTATIIVTANNATVKDTKTAEVKTVKTVEVIEQAEPMQQAEPMLEETNIVPPVEQIAEQTIIEAPDIISDEEKKAYIYTQYSQLSSYFFDNSPQVHIWLNRYFNTHLEDFTYELVDVKMSKIKAHFIDMKYSATLIEVVEHAQTLVL